MNRTFAGITFALVFGFAPPVGAQAIDDEFQSWGAYIFTGQLEREAPSLRAWTDLHVRRGSGGSVLIARPGLGYTFAPWITLWAGYAWVPTFDDAAGSQVDEHRIWQQLTLQHAAAGWLVQSRTRLEQRFSELADDVGLRVREFVRVNYRPWPDLPFGVAVWDELFVGLNDPGWAVQGFDQNRLFVGPALYVMKSLRIEVGYAFVYLGREPADRIQHVWGVNFFTAIAPSR
ncbi:MAG: DUF2490 domain-containing protein [Myxococcales bacterium]|nr:DUF2490 domain-containing protein [Myxococcales bacterium]